VRERRAQPAHVATSKSIAHRVRSYRKTICRVTP
jgi:hypothetical protein